MIDRIAERFGMSPDKLVGDTRYVSAEMLGCLVEERGVAQDIRKTDASVTSFIQRRKAEMLFAHLRRHIGAPMIRLRGPKGAYEQFQLTATAQNLRELAKLVPQPESTG